MKEPRDYATPEERMGLPRAERRHRGLATGVLVCMVMFALAGGFVGAMAMWAYMSL